MYVQNSTEGDVEIQGAPLYEYEADLVQRYSRGFAFAFCLLGIWSNCINIRTFLRIKLEDTVTILFFFLAVCDLVISAVGIFENVAQTMDILQRDWNKRFFISPYVLFAYGGCAKTLFAIETTFIRLFLAIQRCLCVVIPFQVKNLFTPFRTYFYIGVTSTIIAVITGLWTATWRVVRMVNPLTNTSYLELHQSQDLKIAIYIVNAVISSPFNLAAQFTIIACLIAMIVSLKKGARFRKISTMDASQNKQNSKERQALVQVTIVCAIFVISFIPATTYGFFSFLIPDFRLYGTLHYLTMLIIQLMGLGDLFNSAVNFFIYYQFNSKFRKHCFLKTEKVKALD